jgi:hypothetical protein
LTVIVIAAKTLRLISDQSSLKEQAKTPRVAVISKKRRMGDAIPFLRHFAAPTGAIIVRF